ncbi:MAG: YeiH family protein [Pseudomonadales bacterium]
MITALPLAGLALAVAMQSPLAALLMGIGLTVGRGSCPSYATRWGSRALQSAIVLLGFSLNGQDVLALGPTTLYLTSATVCAVLAAGFLSWTLLRPPRILAALLSAGTAICGGTTVATLAPVLKAKPEDTATCLALIFLLNAVAVLVYPVIGAQLALSDTQFGLWAALSIHDTASVLAAAASFSPEALETATVVKLGRTLWLIPLTLVASALTRRRGASPFPPFILFFLAAVMLRTFLPLGPVFLSATALTSKTLLLCALFLIGMQIDREALKTLSPRLWAQGLLLWLLASGGVLIALLTVPRLGA